ncbi:MAG: hypothetical protein E7161_00555 [Firmicutes bacterium]|nr:hypothetical protein [Bacillota bacterium]
MRKKNIIKNTISILLYQIIYILCGLLIPKVLMKGYGSETYALTTSITQFLAYITLLESGLGIVVKSILYKPIAKKNDEEIATILKNTQKFFNKILIVFIFYIVLLCFMYPHTTAANGFDKSLTISLIVIISLSTFFEYFFGMTYKLFLQADQKSYIVSNIQLITYIANTIAIVVMVYLGFDIVIVKLISSLIFVLRPTIQNIYVKRRYNINLRNGKDNFKIPNRYDGLSQHIAGIINSNSDITLLTIFTDIANVAIYSVYNMILTNIKALINSFTLGTDAAFGDMYAKQEYEKLNKSFDIYETIYLQIITILFGCTLILIVPFISVYTKGISDVNYINYSFAFLIVLASYFHCIKTPYNSLAYDAGKFKETKHGAWIEAIINIVVSLILVFKFGLIGVLIGTLMSVIYRGVEFIIYVSKHILKRKVLESAKKIFICFLQIIIIIVVSNYIDLSFVDNYYEWVLAALVAFITISILVFAISCVFYRDNIKEIITKLKMKFTKKSNL